MTQNKIERGREREREKNKYDREYEGERRQGRNIEVGNGRRMIGGKRGRERGRITFGIERHGREGKTEHEKERKEV